MILLILIWETGDSVSVLSLNFVWVLLIWLRILMTKLWRLEFSLLRRLVLVLMLRLILVWLRCLVLPLIRGFVLGLLRRLEIGLHRGLVVVLLWLLVLVLIWRFILGLLRVLVLCLLRWLVLALIRGLVIGLLRRLVLVMIRWLVLLCFGVVWLLRANGYISNLPFARRFINVLPPILLLITLWKRLCILSRRLLIVRLLGEISLLGLQIDSLSFSWRRWIVLSLNLILVMFLLISLSLRLVSWLFLVQLIWLPGADDCTNTSLPFA